MAEAAFNKNNLFANTYLLIAWEQVTLL